MYRYWRIRSEAPPERELASLSLAPGRVKVIMLDNGESKHGLAYHTPPHRRSYNRALHRIFAEISSDLGSQFRQPRHGDLREWSSRGIFLHVNRERWSKLTYEVMRQLSTSRNPVVWMLWGNRAQEFSSLVPAHHLKLTAGYPGSAGPDLFSGCKHFSKAAEFLNVNPLTFWSLS